MSDKTEHPPLPAAFAELGMRDSVLRTLAELRYETPSEIQRLLIPRAMAGVDLLGQARTGTGKTAAFGLPIICRCERDLEFQAIILVPTRELAVQVDAEIVRLAQFTPIRSVPVYGGEKIAHQLRGLQRKPQIIVGTPGRVMDLLERRMLHFRNVRFVVLDEVDRMLDIGFRDDIRRILSKVGGMSGRVPPSAREGSPPSGHSSADAPDATHQTIFVSATISPEIEKLARQYMKEPVEKLIAPGADDKPTVENVEQFYFTVQPWDKYKLLKLLLDRENPELAIVFCRTKHGAEKLAHRLHADGIECREIHGNLAQNKRDRVMKSFRQGKFEVLVATDLASRGIDVADISHIINFDIPEDPEVYVHRIGRTARMGAAGKAYTFVHRDQGDELTRVEALINMVIQQGSCDGFAPTPEPMHRDGAGGGGGGFAPAPEPPKAPAPPAPPRYMGSKQPVGRRRKLR